MDGLPVSTKKPLPRCPKFVDRIRLCMNGLYYHPSIQKVQGYHFGILCCAVISAIVMVINLTLTIWASKHYGLQEGLGTILDGSCIETKKLAIWTHLGINALSTLLLGASNYTMQCLSSLTREDINRAHSQNVWLNIGTPSIRNLLYISRSRMLLWWLVAISSVPIHLMYNSAVFTTLSAHEYNAFLVQPDFLTGAPFNIGAFSAFTDQEGVWKYESSDQVETVAHTLQDGRRSLQKLANHDCKSTYAAEFISSHANVLLVAFLWNGTQYIQVDQDNSILQFWSSRTQGATNDFPWFCGGEPCDTKKGAESAVWQLGGYNIEYCLSQTVEEHCKIQFSGAIMVIVVVCNFCKMVIMGYIAWKRPPEPLVTVGDAIASFLDQPDPKTIGNCLAGKDQFENTSLSGQVGDRALKSWGEGTMRCDVRASYWFRAVSKRRWRFLFML